MVNTYDPWQTKYVSSVQVEIKSSNSSQTTHSSTGCKLGELTLNSLRRHAPHQPNHPTFESNTSLI